MAKVPKLKNRAPSSKSRAARRAPSPSISVKKSLQETTTTHAEPKDSPEPGPEADLSILSARSGNGIVKKKQKQKQPSRHQRLRKEKGMARADAVVEKLETKVKRSRDKERVIKSRAAVWEDLNSQVLEREPRKSVKKSSASSKNVKTPTNGVNAADDDTIAVDEDYAAAAAALVPSPVFAGSRDDAAGTQDDGVETSNGIDDIT